MGNNKKLFTQKTKKIVFSPTINITNKNKSSSSNVLNIFDFSAKMFNELSKTGETHKDTYDSLFNLFKDKIVYRDTGDNIKYESFKKIMDNKLIPIIMSNRHNKYTNKIFLKSSNI